MNMNYIGFPGIPRPPERTVVRDHRPVHLNSDDNTARETDATEKASINATDLPKIDIEKDGKIKAPQGLGTLFGAVDKFDSDGSRRSLETPFNMRSESNETPIGDVFDALKLEFDRKMTQAKMNGPQKPGSDKLKP
jgi:hypothetical protein